MKKNILTAIALLLIALLLFLFLSPIFFFINKFEELGTLSEIETPYNFPDKFIVLTNVNSLKKDTIKFNGVKVVSFWATWCKPCIDEEPYLETMQMKYEKVSFLQLSFDSLDKQQTLISKLNWKLPTYFISDTNLFKYPKIIPKTVILKDSTIIEEIYGSQKENQLRIKTILDSLDN